MKLHVGCAMWTYAPWQGRYLPHPLSPRERLSAYATWCNAVEGNTTFYATPTLDTVRSWAEQTAPDFRFILKLPRPITHERRLADVDDPLRAFLAAIEPLGPRAHTLWIQLPPSFGPADLGALAGFLRRLPREHRYCVEVRHREFFEDPRVGAAARAGARVTPTPNGRPSTPPPCSAARRRAPPNGRRGPRSRGCPAGRGPSPPSPSSATSAGTTTARTVAGWQPWLETVAGWLREGRSPTVFIHTPDNVDALELARRFHDDVRARVPEIEPLPEPIPTGPPTLF